ncbi:single-stranded DNA-binding protein [Streptomyces sp. NPDC003737]|uniref:single-stranded DNA-binding protein n=1 Tax=Streptomyces sp. NPDC003737 TaxID=3364685 RepID=UPI00368D4088
MAPPIPHVMSGTVSSDVECRFTETGLAVCRFRVTATPSHWDAAAQTWRDSAPIPYICTAWRDLARNATESLTPGVTVLITGRITEIRDNSIYLSVDDLGVSLRQRIAYTEVSLPSPAAAAPVAAHPTPQPAAPSAPRAATRQAGNPPAWWDKQRSSGWSEPAASAADGSPLHVVR